MRTIYLIYLSSLAPFSQTLYYPLFQITSSIFRNFPGFPGKDKILQNIKDKKNKNKEKIDRIYYTCIEFAME